MKTFSPRVTDSVSITGLSKNLTAITPVFKGTLRGFHGVTRNILCFSDIIRNFEVQIIDQQFHGNSSVGPIIFLNTHNVVAQLFSPPVEICSTALIAPLSRQLPSSRPWTKEELARAEEVKQSAAEWHSNLIPLSIKPPSMEQSRTFHSAFEM
jgi:hypothetical protein